MCLGDVSRIIRTNDPRQDKILRKLENVGIVHFVREKAHRRGRPSQAAVSQRRDEKENVLMERIRARNNGARELYGIEQSYMSVMRLTARPTTNPGCAASTVTGGKSAFSAISMKVV